MASRSERTLDNGLREIHRYITAHDENGKTAVSSAVPSALQWQQMSNGARFSLGYTTDEYPVDLNGDKDMSVYEAYTRNLPGIIIPGGTVLRIVDMDPGSTSPMHRTISIDYGVVLEGEIELILDSGETRLLKRGDVTIQRATNHAWRNTSSTEWARMLYVLQEAVPLRLNGETLREDYGGGMDDVQPSAKRSN